MPWCRRPSPRAGKPTAAGRLFPAASGVSRVLRGHVDPQGAHHRCAVGSRGVPRPSLGRHVTGTGPTRGLPPPEGIDTDCGSCAQTVPNSGAFLITPAHSRARGRRHSLVPHQTSYAHLHDPGNRTENPVRGPAACLPAGSGAGPGKPDSQIPRKFPRPFPLDSHSLRSMEPGARTKMRPAR